MSQKTDNLIKLALVFFVSLLSFSIGTYVGKKYSDNQHKLSMLEPKKEMPVSHPEEFVSETHEADKTAPAAPTEATPEALAAQMQKPAALTDSEVAKIAEEFATEEDNTEEKIVAGIDSDEKPVKTIPATTKPVTTVSAAAKPVLPVAAKPVAVKPVEVKTQALPAKVAKATTAPAEKITPTPVDVQPEERLPASIPAKAEVTPLHFTVQIGSFPTQEEAEKMTKALQNKGYKTSFVPAKVNGQFWYRVNVGLFGSIREAQDYKKEFLEKTSLTSAIVQRVQQ